MIQLKVYLFFFFSYLSSVYLANTSQSVLNCIDNSGAALVECALVVGQKRAAQIGTCLFSSPSYNHSLT